MPLLRVPLNCRSCPSLVCFRTALLGAAATVLSLAPGTANARPARRRAIRDERGYTAVEELLLRDDHRRNGRLCGHPPDPYRAEEHQPHPAGRGALAGPAPQRRAERDLGRVDGNWKTGTVTVAHAEAARRDPGTVFARQLAPSRRGQLPAPRPCFLRHRPRRDHPGRAHRDRVSAPAGRSLGARPARARLPSARAVAGARVLVKGLRKASRSRWTAPTTAARRT